MIHIGNVDIKTPSAEEWAQTTEFLKGLGYTWISGKDIVRHHSWNSYRKNSAIRLHDGLKATYGRLSITKERKIVTISEFKKDNLHLLKEPDINLNTDLIKAVSKCLGKI